MHTPDALVRSLTSTEARTTGTEAHTHSTDAVSLTAGGPGSGRYPKGIGKNPRVARFPQDEMSKLEGRASEILAKNGLDEDVDIFNLPHGMTAEQSMAAVEAFTLKQESLSLYKGFVEDSFETTTGVPAWAQQGLTPKSRVTRDDYVVDDDATVAMNKALRNGEPPTDRVLAVDEMVSEHVTTKPLQVYRGVVLPPAKVNELQVGSRVRDAGFQSTCLTPRTAGIYASNRKLLGADGDTVIMRVRVDVGQRAAHVGFGEVVLPRGVEMEVVSRDWSDTDQAWIVDLRVTSPGIVASAQPEVLDADDAWDDMEWMRLLRELGEKTDLETALDNALASLTAGGPGSGRYPKGSGKRPRHRAVTSKGRPESDFVNWQRVSTSSGKVFNPRVSIPFEEERTPEQSYAMNFYASSDGYYELRDAVKEGRTLSFAGTDLDTYRPVKPIDDIAGEVRRAISDMRIAEDTTLFRSMVLPPEVQAQLVPGAVIEHDFFVSMATDPDSAIPYGAGKPGKTRSIPRKNRVMLTVLVPKGARATVGMDGEIVFLPEVELTVRTALEEGPIGTYLTVDLTDPVKDSNPGMRGVVPPSQTASGSVENRPGRFTSTEDDITITPQPEDLTASVEVTDTNSPGKALSDSEENMDNGVSGWEADTVIAAAGRATDEIAVMPDARGGDDWIKVLGWDLPTDPSRFTADQLDRLSKLPAWKAAPKSIKSLVAGGPGSGRYPKGAKVGKFKQTDFDSEFPSQNDDDIFDTVAGKVAARWKVSDSGLKALSREERIDFGSPEEACQFYLRQWAGGGGGPVASAAIQHVYEQLGGVAPQEFRGVKYIRADKDLDQATRSLGDAIYGLTQDHFKEKGVTEVTLYRAGSPDGNGMFTSWAGDYGGTRAEAYPGIKVTERSIPVERIFSTYGTGFGTRMETEAVVLGELPGLAASASTGESGELDSILDSLATPGQTLAERARIEAIVSLESQKAFEEFVAGVVSDASTQPTEVLTAGLTLTLATVLRRWTLFAIRVARKIGELFGLDESRVSQVTTRLTQTPLPNNTVELVRGVLRDEGGSEQLQQKLTDALTENLQPWAAKRVVRTETTSVFNEYRLLKLDSPYKKWVTHHDEAARETHAAADGQVVPIGGSFRVGNDLLLYPGDHTGSPGEVINCRCVVVGTFDQPDSLTAGGPGSGRYPRGSGKNPQAHWRNPVKPAVPEAHHGHVPTQEELNEASEREKAIRSSRESPTRSGRVIDSRGHVDTAVYLEAAGYLEPPTVLPTEEFDKVKGLSVNVITLEKPKPPKRKYTQSVSEQDEFWRGITPDTHQVPDEDNPGFFKSVPDEGKDSRSLYRRTVGDPPDETRIGWGVYVQAPMFVGTAHNAQDFAGALWVGSTDEDRKEPTHTVVSDKRVYLRTKIHPDAKVGTWEDVPRRLRNSAKAGDVTRWAVEQGYDVLDLSGTGDERAGVAILNRSMLIIEEAPNE